MKLLWRFLTISGWKFDGGAAIPNFNLGAKFDGMSSCFTKVTFGAQ